MGKYMIIGHADPHGNMNGIKDFEVLKEQARPSNTWTGILRLSQCVRVLFVQFSGYPFMAAEL